MSIRAGLLALLAEDCSYGNQLRLAFEQRTGGTWPLNIGQVYQSLDRLVRDGLVVVEDPGPDQGPAQARARYRITGEGRAQVRAWFAQPVPRTAAPRDELAIKLAIALCSPEADVIALIDGQRTASMGALQAATAVKRRALAADPGAARQPWLLVLDRLLFDIEAELRWLDLCESSLIVPRPRASVSGAQADPVPSTPEESR